MGVSTAFVNAYVENRLGDVDPSEPLPAGGATGVAST